MSKLYFGRDSNSVSEDDEDNLPYPEALPRSDFLAPNFDAPTYLSTLSDRHQTLEDLRSDLRERSQALSKELLDLVNTNYEQFLSLGSDLKGGEERVEDVRVGLLAFQRGVEDVRGKVRERRVEVQTLLLERKGVTKQIAVGRKLLEVDDRLEELEDRLMVTSLSRPVNAADDDSWSESDGDEEVNNVVTGYGVSGTGAEKLQRLVADYRNIESLCAKIGSDHPFIVAQRLRIMCVRNTILLDLENALKESVSMGEEGKARLIRILAIYRELGAGCQAIKVLKDLKS